MSNEVTLAEYLATLPIHVGYELDEHVLAIPIDHEGVPRMVATLHWDLTVAPARDLAEMFAARVIQVARINDLGSAFLLVGYGPDGADRVQQVYDAMLATADLPLPLVVHIEHDSWRQRHGAAEWSGSRRLPEVRAAAVIAGDPLPAASRAALGRRFEPGPTLFEAAAPPGFTWQARPPSFRAEILTRSLDRLATPGHPHEPDRMAIIAVLMTTDVAVRDAGIAAAANDRGRADALVRTYQASPMEVRAPLAAAAATALFLRGESNVVVEAILKHAARTGRGATLTKLVEWGMAAGLDPHELRNRVTSDVQHTLAEADTRWEQARQHHVSDDLATCPTAEVEDQPVHAPVQLQPEATRVAHQQPRSPDRAGPTID